MLETIARIPHDAQRDYDEDYVAERRARLSRQTGAALSHTARYSFKPEDARGNIENFIGVAQIPLGNQEEIERLGVTHLGSMRQVQSAVAVPMRMSNRFLGMISAQSYEPYAFGAEEQALLEMLAAHAATAIENGRLFESEQKRRQEAENLRQAATAISSTLDPDQVLTEILKALTQVIHYDHASVFLHEGEWLRLAIVQGVPDSTNLAGSKFPANYELSEQIKVTQARSFSRMHNETRALKTGGIHIISTAGWLFHW